MTGRIEDYALLSDCQSAARVGRDGSVDWLCLPRFDSAACFAALLGTTEHGRWLLHAPNAVAITRSNVDDTLVLEPEYVTATGLCRVRDCILMGDAAPTLVRLVEGLQGEVALQTELIIRFDYAGVGRAMNNRNGPCWTSGEPAFSRFQPRRDQ